MFESGRIPISSDYCSRCGRLKIPALTLACKCVKCPCNSDIGEVDMNSDINNPTPVNEEMDSAYGNKVTECKIAIKIINMSHCNLFLARVLSIGPIESFLLSEDKRIGIVFSVKTRDVILEIVNVLQDIRQFLPTEAKITQLTVSKVVKQEA